MALPRHYRAPSEDGGLLIEPPIARVPELLAANRQILATASFDFCGRSLSELRAQAQRELVSAARDYTSQYRAIPPASVDPSRPILLSGHQPELFHPGVWFKNFLLSALAQANDATAINFIVDHDTLGQPAIAVPTGSLSEPRLENVPFDAFGEELPFEERSVSDRAAAESFPEHVWNALDSLPYGAPGIVLDSLWPHVLEQLERHGNWGRAIAAGRHILEGEWGLQTLELPTSSLWDSEPFGWFATTILADLPRFAAAYNRALAGYRQANGLKSVQHPVPDLSHDGNWLETPFWHWSSARPQRERLYVRPGANFTSWKTATSRGTFSNDGARALEDLKTLRRSGGKIRPRALLTTLYARLFLSDLFIHGIGGAKYDEVTDAILADYFRCSPPAYLTATATLRLPLPRPDVADSDLRQVRQQLRDLQWHGEQFASLRNRALVDRKKSLLAHIPDRGNRSKWHQEITQVNRALADSLRGKRSELENTLSQNASELRRARLLGSREFSFCLFPEATLRTTLNAGTRIPLR